MASWNAAGGIEERNMTKNILLVEYDESTIHAIKALLHPPAFELVIAGDGETAKQLLQNKSFDMMITAAMLPRFHGFNLALAVSQDHPNMKIIVISAIYKGLEYRHQAITQYRANDFFEKPLDKDKFKKRVLELLNMTPDDMADSSPAASTRVPMFDTAKIPALKLDDNEENKLSSADIFGDIIQKIEKVPEFEIDLGDGSRAAPIKTEARKPDASRTVQLKGEAFRPPAAGQTVIAPSKPSSPAEAGQTVIAPGGAPVAPKPFAAKAAKPAFDLDSLKTAPKSTAAPAAPRAVDAKIGASLDGLRTPEVKREVSKDQMRKIEDDIARKFEDTLSGLGLQAKPATPARPSASPPAATPPPRPEAKTVVLPEIKVIAKPEPAATAPAIKPEPPPPPPKPAAAAEPASKVMVKEIQETFVDQVIDLGEEAALLTAPPFRAPEPPPIPAQPLRAPAPPPVPPPPPLVYPETREEKKPPVEAREAKYEKPPVAEDNPNEVGDYVLLGLIARGGMAEIYKAKKKGVKGFEKVIAIKKILSGYGEDDKFIEMLVDEAKIAAELSHPNIVQIYDLGRKDNYYFIAMEYVLGKDLREIQTRLRERDQWFPEEIAIFLTIKILEALNYAHKAKDSRGRSLDIVHRDVSPPNILISYNGDVKLTDFGVSKASIKMHQTLSGALKGKLLYMSPEQACGESTIDYRSDLYSVGVLLFELLTGKKLFLDTSEMLVLKKVQNGEIINPREINPDIDPALERILLVSLSKDCDKRYQSAAAMIADLEAYVHKKYDRASGPLHLSHFIYGIFENDIHREGIKVDLKPLPYVPKVREIVKPQPPPEKPKPVDVPAPAPPPVPPPVATPTPRPPVPVSISFDEEKPAPKAPKPVVEEKIPLKPESIFHEMAKEKRKFPLVPLVAVLLVVVLAVALYFLVFNKPGAQSVPQAAPQAQGQAQTGPATPDAQSEAQKAEMQKIADQLAATQKLLDEAKLKQEEELKKIQDEEDRKKLVEDRRKKAEADRLKQEEADRLKQEEAARLKQEEENRLQQEELARTQKAEDERKKAEDAKRAEMKRAREGDIIALGEVDAQPQPLATPSPSIPASILSSLNDSVTVVFTILINHTGDVETARLLQKSTNPQLNILLTELIKTWKYQPATKDNVRVKVWKTVPISIKK
ncbi:MAG: protein kinase [Acidobacteria bacterium]|nr:protein kinase [Acidobacteriota bacterium]